MDETSIGNGEVPGHGTFHRSMMSHPCLMKGLSLQLVWVHSYWNAKIQSGIQLQMIILDIVVQGLCRNDVNTMICTEMIHTIMYLLPMVVH